ncbi:MAG TPA: hypothetical protein VGL80_06850 [Pseudonocardiaceae bacterium]
MTLHPLTHQATFRKGRAAVLAEAERLLTFLEPDATRHEISFD